MFEDNHRVKVNGESIPFSRLARGIQASVDFIESKGAEHKRVCLTKNLYNRSRVEVSGVEYRLPFKEWGVGAQDDKCFLLPDLAMDQAILMYFYFLGLSNNNNLDAMKAIAPRFQTNVEMIESGTFLRSKLVKFQGYVEKILRMLPWSLLRWRAYILILRQQVVFKH